MSPEQLADVLDCGSPERTWQAMVAHFRTRATMSRIAASDLRSDAEDATQRAAEFEVAADEFRSLAVALENASVTFAASVGRNPEGEDREDGLRAEHEHAFGEAETPERSWQSNKPGREM